MSGSRFRADVGSRAGGAAGGSAAHGVSGLTDAYCAPGLPDECAAPACDSGRRPASALDAQPAPAADPALSVERIAVREGIVVCDVVRSPAAPARTTPELAADIERACPGISRHACVNGEGDTFAAVIDHTSLAHVLEHLVVHLQVRSEPPGSTATFLGTTEPLDAEGRRFRVEVSFRDDLVVLRALREALDLLNGLLADA